MAVLACIIGFGLKMNEASLEQLVMAGLLHDLGKLVIPPEIGEYGFLYGRRDTSASYTSATCSILVKIVILSP